MKSKFFFVISAVSLFCLTLLVPSYNKVFNYIVDYDLGYTCPKSTDVYINTIEEETILRIKYSHHSEYVQSIHWFTGHSFSENYKINTKLYLFYTINEVPQIVKNKTKVENKYSYNPRCGFLNPIYDFKDIISQNIIDTNSSTTTIDPEWQEIFGPVTEAQFNWKNFIENKDKSKKYRLVYKKTPDYDNETGYCNQRFCRINLGSRAGIQSYESAIPVDLPKINYKNLFTLLTFFIFLISLAFYIKNRYKK